MSGNEHIDVAIEHIETARSKTLRGDAVGACQWALDILTDDPNIEDIQDARDVIANGRVGAVGDAIYDFDFAIDELDDFLDVENSGVMSDDD